VRRLAAADADMNVTAGGMSVDPDDVTCHGIRMAGVDAPHYGAAVLPGSMFQLAYRGDMPIAGLPACGLSHQTTISDSVLPRLLAGGRLDEKDLAAFTVGDVPGTVRNVATRPAHGKGTGCAGIVALDPSQHPRNCPR
jgi:molybdopterin biosynthesis enzyme